jgi:hypothetical protein
VLELRKRSGKLNVIDGLLLLAIPVVLGVGVYFLTQSPDWFRLCIETLDMRNWTKMVWLGIGGAFLAVLILIRLWPEKKSVQKQKLP